MEEFYKHKKFIMVLLLLVALSILVKFLPDFANKEEKCEQIAYKAMTFNIIDRNIYQSNKLQDSCIKEWDKRGVSDWRDCCIDADTSKELEACGIHPYISFQ